MNSPADALDVIGGAVTGDLADALNCAAVRAWSDDDVVAMTVTVERLGRLVDAARTALAGDVAERSRRCLGVDALAAKKGCRSPQELLERLTLASSSSVNRRMRLGGEVRTRLSLGTEYPSRFPAVAAAVAGGALGVDSAEVIVRALGDFGSRVPLEQVEIAERELVAAATGVSTDPRNLGQQIPATADEIRLQASVWQAYLDGDGVEPSEERAMAARGIRLGRLREGLIPISGNLMPEMAGRFQRLLDAYLTPRTAPAFLSAEELAAAHATAAHAASEEAGGQESGGALDGSESGEMPVIRDPRSREQQVHDVFGGILDAAARAIDAPTIGGFPPTVLVSVSKDDLEAGTGAGWIDGVDAPLSMRAVKQYACTGGLQKIVFDDTGRIIQLGSPVRCFTGAQRRAIMERDGGCVIHGCSIPAAWTEIHHVEEAAQGGPTHTDNGVCLCWFHHRTIDTSGWQITMIHGVPHLKAPPWLRGQNSSDDRWHPAGTSRTRLASALKRTG